MDFQDSGYTWMTSNYYSTNSEQLYLKTKTAPPYYVCNPPNPVLNQSNYVVQLYS